MSAVNDILNRIPMEQLADRLGTDQATAEEAARQAVASLLGGMQSNASEPGGEASLASALSQHRDDGVYESPRIDLGDVDTHEGDKIVGHVLGQDQPQAVGGLGGDTMSQLLRILAPIVLGYLAGKVTGGRSGSGGSLLDAILGGGMSGGEAPRRSSGGALGDLLGEMLGGGADTSTAPRSSTAGDESPFRPVDHGPDDDRTDRFPTAEASPRRQAPDDDPAPRREGGLGDILGGLFGKR